MEKVTIEKAKKDLIAIFGAVSAEEFRKRKEHLSWYSENSENEDGVTFFIDKNITERGEVFEKLQEYFGERVIEGGYCELSPITFVWTSFELKKGKPNNQ